MEHEFVEMLKKVYHYPEAAVRTDVPKEFGRFDVLIQKGNSYIQAFEIKKAMPRDVESQKKILETLARSLNEFSVDTPIYFATKNKDDKWEIYEYNNLEKPLDINTILNYHDASRRFWGILKDSVDEIPKSFNKKCYWGAGFIGLYMIISFLCECHGCIAPTKSVYIVLLCFILMLLLAPSLLQMTDKIKRFKLGIFEWEFFKNKE